MMMLFSIVFLLLIPYYKFEETLGVGKYGFVMGIMSSGMILGSFILTLKKVHFEKRYLVLMVGTLLLVGAFLLFIYMENYWLKLLLIFMAGVGNAMINTIAGVTFQIFIPQDMRGKVFSLLSTINIALMPLASFIGGVVGEIFDIPKLIMVLLSSFALLFCIVVFRVKSIRRIMNYNPALPSILCCKGDFMIPKKRPEGINKKPYQVRLFCWEKKGECFQER